MAGKMAPCGGEIARWGMTRIMTAGVTHVGSSNGRPPFVDVDAGACVRACVSHDRERTRQWPTNMRTMEAATGCLNFSFYVTWPCPAKEEGARAGSGAAQKKSSAKKRVLQKRQAGFHEVNTLWHADAAGLRW